MARRGSAVAQLLQSVHGGVLLDTPPDRSRARRLSLDSCRHQQGKTRVYVKSKDCNSLCVDPVLKVTWPLLVLVCMNPEDCFYFFLFLYSMNCFFLMNLIL